MITVVAIVSLNFLAYYYYPLESLTLGIGKDDFSGFEIFLIWSALIIAAILASFVPELEYHHWAFISANTLWVIVGFLWREQTLSLIHI